MKSLGIKIPEEPKKELKSLGINVPKQKELKSLGIVNPNLNTYPEKSLKSLGIDKSLTDYQVNPAESNPPGRIKISLGDRLAQLPSSLDGIYETAAKTIDSVVNLGAKKAQEREAERAKIREAINSDTSLSTFEKERRFIEENRKLSALNTEWLDKILAKQDPTQESEFVKHLNQRQAEARQKLKEGMNPVQSVLADAALSGADMASRAATSAITGVPFLMTTGITTGSEAAQKALSEGYSADKALAYGAGSGAITAGIESFGGIAGSWGGKLLNTSIGKSVMSKLPQKAVDYVAKVGATKLGQILGDAGSEGLEEFGEYYAQNLFENILLDKDTPTDIKEALYNAGIGSIVGGVFGGGRAIANTDIKSGLKSLGIKVNEKLRPVTPVEVAETQETPLKPLGIKLPEPQLKSLGVEKPQTGTQDVKFGSAVWKNADYDQPVTITGIAGTMNGKTYVNIAESKAAIPFDEIAYDNTIPGEPQLKSLGVELPQQAASTGVATAEPQLKSLGINKERYQIESEVEYSPFMQLTGSGVSQNKDFARNFDAASGKNQEVREFLKARVEKPFLDAKAEYSKQVQTRLNDFKVKMDSLGIKKGTRESSAVMWYGEGKRQIGERFHEYTITDLKREFPNSWQQIVEADNINRQIYNEYIERTNATLEQIYPNPLKDAYDKVDRLEDAIHYTEKKLGDERVAIIFEMDEAKRGEIQASIDRYEAKLRMANGRLKSLQADIKSGDVLRNKRLLPRKDYYRHFSEIEKGFGGLSNIINGSFDIDPRIVGVSDFTKPKTKWAGFLQARGHGEYVEDSIAAMVNYIPAAEYKINIDPIIANNRAFISEMARATKDTKNANKFIEWMADWTNDLAGKSNPFDRPFQKFFDRKAMQAVFWVNNRVKGNAVLGNINSALAQAFNIPNAAAYIKNPKAWANGASDYVLSLTGDENANGLLSQSDFIRERYLDDVIDQFDESVAKVPEKFAKWMLSALDKEATKLIWLSSYEQGTASGVQDPIRYADDITRRSVAGRGIGEIPIFQKSKVVQFLLPFQIEVNNSWQLQKERVGEKDASGIIALYVVSWLMNGVSELLTGRRILPDIIDAIFDGITDKKEQSALGVVKGAAGRIGGEVISAMPGGSYAASLVLNEDDRKEIFGESDPTRFGTENISAKTIVKPIVQAWKGENIDLLSPALNTLMPFGGKQAERTIRGAQDMGWLPKVNASTKDGVSISRNQIPASYSQGGGMRFPIDPTVGNVASLLALGPYATKEGKEYIENNSRPFSESKTKKIENAVRAGVPQGKFLEISNALKGIQGTRHPNGLTMQLSADKKKKVTIDEMTRELTQYQRNLLYELFDISKSLW